MTELSPYGSVGATLVANGYSAIPISPADKMPARFVRGEWWPMKDWSRYCTALPGGFEVRLWAGWPEANVGIACGRGLIAFDIDQDDLVREVLAVLPPCVVGKRGRKGETLFYRGDTTAIRSKGYRRRIPGNPDPKATEGLMDLIADGKQTVIPPSIHPDTAAPYTWTTERTLLDTPIAELSEVTIEHVEAVVEILRAHGWQQAETFKPVEAAGIEVAGSAESTGEWFRRLNEDALGNLHAWVPRLGLERLQRSGDGYRSVAQWRPSGSGKPLHKRHLYLSIDPHGIVDYGDGEKGYTAINLVMAALDERDLSRAAVWLGESLGYDFSPVILNQKRARLSPREEAARLYREAREADGGAVAPVAAPEPPPAVLAHPGASAPASEGLAPEPSTEPPSATVLDFPEPEDAEPSQSPEERIQALVEGVPGLVGDLVEWMRVTADVPNPVFAFATSLCFLGTLAGRHYKSPTDLRTNFYCVGLAPSGFGKEHSRQVIDRLVSKGNFGRYMGGEQIMSGSALRKRVSGQPSCFYQIDEFGGFWRDINNSKMPHSFQIRSDLLKMFSTAAVTFRGADYAGELGQPIENPNVSVYGTSTPADFWASCRSLSVADGLIARCLIFTCGGDRLPPLVEATADKSEPPAALVKRLQDLALSKVGGNLNGVISDGTTKCEAMLVPWADESARSFFYELKNGYREKGFALGEEEGGLWNRAAEHIQKMALLISIGQDVRRPMIRRSTLELCRDIVELLTEQTYAQISGRLADNDRQREHVDVKRWVVEAGADGIGRTAIAKRVNGRFDRRRLDDILKSLEEDSREIFVQTVKPAGKGRPGVRYFALEALVKAAEA